MGCSLPKPGGDGAPGKIYSTLRKPQVETRNGVAYTYHFLDFLLGKEEVAVSSLLCLSSVRELPVQVCEFYQQGFILAAVHPFVHSSGPAGANLQRQLHRAVLIRETHRCSENGLLKCVRPRLETDVCFSGLEVPDPDVIQGYVKKVQDLADSGVLFTGFLQQPGGGVSFLGHWDPGEFSSLHSSPSPINRHPSCPVPSPRSTCPDQDHQLNYRSEDHQLDGPGLTTELQNKDYQKCDQVSRCPNNCRPVTVKRGSSDLRRLEAVERQTQVQVSMHRDRTDDHRTCSVEPLEEEPYTQACRGPLRAKHPEQLPDRPEEAPDAMYFLNRVQVFALYNHAVVLSGSPRFYSLRIPLQVHKEAGLITTVDAHWLDHMTQHFRSGAQLIDGYFHLGDDAESLSTMESVFIFQSASNDVMTTTYDAIVVEQWTIIDGVAVKTDYIPLLQTLARYGWRLMCVLATPIVKTNSDGSLATKQFLFLQRPVLSRKRRDFRRLHLKSRNKRNLNGKQTIGKELLCAASPVEEMTRTLKECEYRRTSESELRLTSRGPPNVRAPRVMQYSSPTQGEKGAGKSASTNQDAKEGVACGTRAKTQTTTSIIREQTLFSGVC
ncbi:raftlin isoform X2 [Brachyhypopomus gauderio]|uniref:raftlin isoform X2 n=1 Tax=Brachyhypopomus gauderio TaxID=698409 RepID=UPI00404311F1